ncbi:DUF6456 domain-containing protein [Enterovirga aerilata]|uniref:ATPase n=1 Tax=Enterovirga aerilata TaxID=2730920 RepID=A0A849I5R7_9HYPH|nr:DUF6456 domain-containing protein [Enterovirga sp. DB1703]NNM72671.1 ATPase [Enterovirga sp. DB1703]
MNINAVSNSATLSKAARRLLAALAEPGASAIPDPSREGMLILRGARHGISIGRGCVEEKVCRELQAHDLVTRGEAGRAVVISETGRRHLRRGEAPRAESAFQQQHAEIETATITDETGPAKVALNAAESPLDWLRRRRDRDGKPLIDAACHEAGERLRRDLTFGGLLPSITARWEGSIGSGGAGPRDPAAAADAVVAARQRVRNALAAVGQDFADLLLDLCGFLKGLETIERERRWPPRSAKVVVRLALRRLAEHYGLETEARGPAQSRGVRSWAAEESAA